MYPVFVVLVALGVLLAASAAIAAITPHPNPSPPQAVKNKGSE